MKKWLWFFLFFALFLFGSFNAYLYINRTEFTEVILKKLLNTNATVEAVDITKDSLIVHNLYIHNGEKSNEKPAFSAEKITIDMGWTNFIKAYIGISSVPAKISLITI